MMHIFILYGAVYSLGYNGSLLSGQQALPAWVRGFVSAVLLLTHLFASPG